MFEFKNLDDFELDLKVDEKSDVTIKGYLQDLRLFSKWCTEVQIKDISEISEHELLEYKTHSRKHGHKPGTVNRRLAAIGTFLKWAEKMNIIKKCPDLPKKIKETRKPPRSLELKDFRALRREFHREGKKRNIAVFETLAATGVRVSELCNLTLKDLAINERSGWIVVREGKGGKYRQIPLNKKARKALRQYLKIRKDHPDNFVFLGQRGNPLSPRAIQLIISNATRRIGLEATPHTLRHTFGRRLLQTGSHLNEVAQLMGHERLDTTAIYTKASISDLECAVERLEEE